MVEYSFWKAKKDTVLKTSFHFRLYHLYQFKHLWIYVHKMSQWVMISPNFKDFSFLYKMITNHQTPMGNLILEVWRFSSLAGVIFIPSSFHSIQQYK